MARNDGKPYSTRRGPTVRIPEFSEKLTAPRIYRDFSTQLLIEYLPAGYTPDQVWDTLNAIADPRVVHRRVYVDPHEMLSRTAILYYRSNESMLEAAPEFDGMVVEGQKIRATPVIDRIQQMVNIEKEILEMSRELNKNFVTELQGLVSMISEAHKPVEMAARIFEKCGKIRKIKNYPCKATPVSYVLLFLNFCSEAYACELAYNNVIKAGYLLKIKSENPKITIPRLQALLDDLKKMKEEQSKLSESEQEEDLKVSEAPQSLQISKDTAPEALQVLK